MVWKIDKEEGISNIYVDAMRCNKIEDDRQKLIPFSAIDSNQFLKIFVKKKEERNQYYTNKIKDISSFQIGCILSGMAV